MIKIRLQRNGARHAPFYRMVVAPSQARRDGRFIEVLGTYNPQAHKRDEELKLKIDRIDYWLGVGAQPTDTAKSLIRQGRMSPEDWLNRAEKISKAKLKRNSNSKSAPSMIEGAGDDKAEAEAKPVEKVKVEEAPVEEEKSVEEEPEKEVEPAAAEPKAKAKPAEEAKAEEAPAEEEKPVEEESEKEDEPTAAEPKATEKGDEDSAEEKKKKDS